MTEILYSGNNKKAYIAAVLMWATFYGFLRKDLRKSEAFDIAADFLNNLEDVHFDFEQSPNGYYHFTRRIENDF